MNKITIKLVHKVNLLDNITCLLFKTTDHLDFEPGQYLAIQVAPKVYRSYSLYCCSHFAPTFYPCGLTDLQHGKYIGLMINTKPDGVGSHWAKNIQLDQEFMALGCNGSFGLKVTGRPKVFVGSSTGIAPFVPMVAEVLKFNKKINIQVFFGSLDPRDDFSKTFFGEMQSEYKQLQLIACYDNLDDNMVDAHHKHGRVTQVIMESMTNEQMQATDFYICGNPMMVEAMVELLEKQNVQGIFVEKYS
jgi:ferredoxin-NADP reductase